MGTYGIVLLLACTALAVLLVAGGALADPVAAENETIHEHPDEAEDDGDLDEIADWLGLRLGDMLGDSAIEISESEYELAREHLGDDYDQRLSEYISIAGESDRESDAEAVDAYETAKETQLEYIELSEEFDETLAAFEEAIAEGDEERARELLRELERIAAELQQRSEELDEAYDLLEELTTADFEEAQQSIDERMSAVSATVDERDEVELVNTSISVEPYDEAISTTSPLELTGTVESENGTPVESGTITIATEHESTTVDIGEQGTFDATFQPVMTLADSDEVSVTYEADPTSIYRHAETTVPVDIEQVSGLISQPRAPSSATYGDIIEVEASVSVEGTAIDGVPLSASVGETDIGSATTDAAGDARIVESLGKTPADGHQVLALEGPSGDRALLLEPVTVRLLVESTATTLDASANDDPEQGLIVTGSLETIAGDVIAGEPITIAPEGALATTVETNTNGEFTATFDDIDGEEGTELPIDVTYDGSETNLESSHTETTAVLTAASVLPIEDSDSWTMAVVVAFLLILGGLGLAVHKGWIPSFLSGQSGEPATSVRSDSPIDGATDEPSDEPTIQPADWLHDAQRELDNGETRTAIDLAYVATRRSLSPSLENGYRSTHWEFVAACEAAGISQLDTLRELTATYEHAAFAPTDPPIEAGRSAIAASEQLIEASS